MIKEDTALRCFFTIAGNYGIQQKQQEIQAALPKVDCRNDKEALERFAKKLKIKVKSEQFTPERLKELVCPAVAVLGTGDHVIIIKVLDDKIIMYDPREREGQIAVPTQLFLVNWTGEIIFYLRPLSKKALLAKYNISWFMPTILHYKKFFKEVLVSAFFLQLFGIFTPLFTQVIIDKVIANNGMATLDVLIGSLLILGLFQNILSGMRTYVLTHTTNKLDVILGARLFRHLVSLPLNYFERQRVGNIMMYVQSLAGIREFLTGTAITVFIDVIFSFVFFAFMFSYSVPLTIISLAALPVYLIQNILVTPIYRKKLMAMWAVAMENNSFLVEAVTGIHTIKSLALEPQFKYRWENILAKYIRVTFNLAAFNICISNIGGLVQKLSSFTILWYGGYLVMDGKLTLGQLIAFQMLAGQASTPIIELVGMWQKFQQSGIAMEMLGSVLHTPSEPVLNPVPANLGVIKGAIVFDNVTFRYAADMEPVLRGVNLVIKQGTAVGIVGRSGSGKSTLTKLMQRMYEPEAGKIFIDSHLLAESEPHWLRRQMGVVMQENYLFSGSVRDNISLSSPSASMEEVIRVAQMAGAHEFILELQEGYDTRVGERGASLSGGQRQRVAIARALLNNPRILIFDEATSALDYESERIIMENLDKIASGRTLVMIAHRLSTVRYCDKIIVMEQGKILEEGTHEELLNKEGLYYNLYRQQEGMNDD